MTHSGWQTRFDIYSQGPHAPELNDLWPKLPEHLPLTSHSSCPDEQKKNFTASTLLLFSTRCPGFPYELSSSPQSPSHPPFFLKENMSLPSFPCQSFHVLFNGLSLRHHTWCYLGLRKSTCSSSSRSSPSYICCSSNFKFLEFL